MIAGPQRHSFAIQARAKRQTLARSKPPFPARNITYAQHNNIQLEPAQQILGPARDARAGACIWDELLVGRMPLVGMEPLAAILPGSASAPLQQHSFIMLASSQSEACWVLDFLPAAPTDPVTLVTLLSGGSVKGKHWSLPVPTCQSQGSLQLCYDCVHSSTCRPMKACGCV